MLRAARLFTFTLFLGAGVNVAVAQPGMLGEFNRQQRLRSNQALKQWVRHNYGKTNAGTGRLYHTREGRTMRQLAQQRLRAHQLGYGAVGAHIPRPPSWLLK